jgi:zinc transport system substrate-binding protein
MFDSYMLNSVFRHWCLFTVMVLLITTATAAFSTAISEPAFTGEDTYRVDKPQSKPVVLTSIRPLGLLAQEVVGDHGVVEVLLKGNVSPHHYALSVADRELLLSADTVLWIGPLLEQFLVRPLAQRDEGVITAMSLDGIQWPEVEDAHDHASSHHGHDHGDGQGNKDPHLWLNPLNNLAMIDALVADLGQKFPAYQAAYQDNGNALKAKLVLLDQQILADTRLEDGSISVAPFVVAHPAYQHFVARYSLPQLGYVALTPERRAGAKQLYRLRQLTALRCIFVDYGWDNKGAVQLAKDVDVPLFTLNPLGESEQREDGEINNSETIIQLLTRLSVDFRRCKQPA